MRSASSWYSSPPPTSSTAKVIPLSAFTFAAADEFWVMWALAAAALEMRISPGGYDKVEMIDSLPPSWSATATGGAVFSVKSTAPDSTAGMAAASPLRTGTFTFSPSLVKKPSCWVTLKMLVCRPLESVRAMVTGVSASLLLPEAADEEDDEEPQAAKAMLPATTTPRPPNVRRHRDRTCRSARWYLRDVERITSLRSFRCASAESTNGPPTFPGPRPAFLALEVTGSSGACSPDPAPCGCHRPGPPNVLLVTALFLEPIRTSPFSSMARAARSTRPANTPPVASWDVANWMWYPIPSLDEMNSPTMAPTSACATPSFRPRTM